MSETLTNLFQFDVLKNAMSFSAADTLVGMLLAFLLGILIALTYKKTFAGVMYARTYAVTLVVMTMISALLLMAVTSNAVLTLGMLGALSIIRFRTAIKEPMDVAFMFWAVAAGITVGAGLIGLGVIGSLLIALAFVLLCRHGGKHSVPYILVVHCDAADAEESAVSLTRNAAKKMSVKSKTVGENGTELILDIRLKGSDTKFVTEISALPGVRDAALMTYNGEYVS